MLLETKALYNLIKFNFLEDSTLKCENWQVEDLRDEKLDILFKKLLDLRVDLNKESFLSYAKKMENPEDLTNFLVKDSKIYDRVYLIIFELWRRFLLEKLSLSIFCDELDHRIYLYVNDKLKSDELIQDVIANLLDILNDNIDLGKNPKIIFQHISKYLAYDIEIFLYDYIADQIDYGHDLYAMELIEEFYMFVNNIRWFDFFSMKLVFETDEVEARAILKSIVKELEKKPDINLQIEILKFMIESGDPDIFLKLLQNTLKKIEIEKDFIEVMEIASDFYRRLDRDKKDLAIQKIIKKRSKGDPLKKINLKDPDMKSFKEFLSIS